MKNQILLFLFIPFLTNCGTITGLTIDTIRNNKKRNNTYNVIHQKNQPITFQTYLDIKMRATYKGLAYKTGAENTQSSIIDFPSIGDSQTVLYANHKTIAGEFSGFKKFGPEYQLMVFNDNLKKTDLINFSSINKITWKENLLGIHDLYRDHLYLKYDSVDLRDKIALSELIHLNITKEKMTYTKIGLGFDLFVGIVGFLAIRTLGGFDFDFGSNQ